MDPRIDRLRGLLALGVMLGHTIDLARLSTVEPSGTLFAIAMATRPFFGFICVVGFIVLSGYCVTRSTLKGFTLDVYVIKRVTRVYPLLVVAVLLTGLFEWIALGNPNRPPMWGLNGDGRDFRKFLAALLGFSGFKGPFGAIAPAATISLELLYYTIWGLAMTAASGRGRRALLIAGLAGAVLMMFGDQLRAALGWQAGFVPVTGIVVLPGWLLGAGLAVAEKPLTRAARVVPGWAIWIVFVWLFTYANDRFNLPFNVLLPPSIVFPYFTTMSGLIVAIVASWLARPAPAPRATDIWLGEMSYPLFLMHGPAIMATQFALNAAGVHLTFVGHLALLLAAAFLAAMAAVRLVERPVMAWRRGFRPRPEASAPALAETA